MSTGETPLKKQLSNTSDAQLKEGEDYYLENNRWVFTEKYHLKRGYCCGSGCRHCPYSNKKKAT